MARRTKSARSRVRGKQLVKPAVAPASNGFVWASVILVVLYLAIHLPMLRRSLDLLGGLIEALVYGR